MNLWRNSLKEKLLLGHLELTSYGVFHTNEIVIS